MSSALLFFFYLTPLVHSGLITLVNLKKPSFTQRSWVSPVRTLVAFPSPLILEIQQLVKKITQAKQYGTHNLVVFSSPHFLPPSPSFHLNSYWKPNNL